MVNMPCPVHVSFLFSLLESHSRKEPAVLTLTGTHSPPCLVKARFPLPIPLCLTLSSLPGFSPEGPRAPRPIAKPQDAMIGFQGAPSPLIPPSCVAVVLRAPSREHKAPWLHSYASTCRGIHLKPLSTVCLFGTCTGAKGYEWSCIPELSMIPIRLCQSGSLPGRKLGFLFPSPQKGDHTLAAD